MMNAGKKNRRNVEVESNLYNNNEQLYPGKEEKKKNIYIYKKGAVCIITNALPRHWTDSSLSI